MDFCLTTTICGCRSMTFTRGWTNKVCYLFPHIKAEYGSYSNSYFDYYEYVDGTWYACLVY